MIMDDSDWGLIDPLLGHQLPPRSRLVNLAPLGQGTSQVESLGSYFMRLADAHSLQPTALAWETVFPENAPIRRSLGECWRRPYFSGIGEATQDWVQVLEGLTMANDLKSLTMGFLRGRSSMRGLVCEKSRWCPTCFKEDAEVGVPYGRLLWTFQAVTCCPKHRTKLVERCDCGANDTRVPGLAKCLPNICVKCSCDLGDTQDLDHEAPTARELRQAELVADLLVSEVALGGQAPGRDLTHFLDDSVTRHTEGKAARLACLLGVGKSTFHGWIHGWHFPDFAQIITIAESHGCSISDVLCGRSEVATRNPIVPWSEHTRPSGNVVGISHRKLDWDAIEKNLDDFLRAEVPLSLVEVSQQLGIAKETLRQNRPALCVAISARWKEWNAATAKRRGLELEERVRGIAYGLARRGIQPTWRMVLREGFPSIPSWRGTRRLYAICKEARLDSSLK
jgi:hypothetical protein